MINFDEPVCRKNTDCIKWDRLDQQFNCTDVLPLWIADMDFKVAEPIQDALHNRINHGVFGYTYISPSVMESVVYWFKRRNNIEINQNTLVLTPTVLMSLDILIQVLTKQEDAIIMFTPVYYPFFKITEALGRKPIHCPMKLENAYYSIDFELFEKQLIEFNPKVLILCNPHNPGNRVWTVDELNQIALLCEKYQVEIISDDIHRDIIYPGYSYTPIFTVAKAYQEHIYTISAPTKTFNIAGIGGAYTIFFNTHVKRLFTQFMTKYKYPSISIFSLIALESAYTHCEPWLDKLTVYLHNNYLYMQEQLRDTSFELIQGEGTFLTWIDYRKYTIDEKTMYKLLLDNKLGVQMGSIFGTGGDGFFRLNIGTQKDILIQVCQILHNIHTSLL